ncbi:MAG TPA: EI24 domain-containing protein [Thermopolyspora sp.]
MSGPARGVGGFAAGAGSFLRGVQWVSRNPRWWLFGLIPALVALIIYVAVLTVLAVRAGDLADLLTPFADDWAAGVRDILRVLVAIVIVGAGLALAVVTFTALTLVVGEPFYEKLSEQVEKDLGGVPVAQDVPLWLSVARSLRDSVITLWYTLLLTTPLFVLGFVPGIGQTVVPVLGALVSGFFLTVELTALAMERRGLSRGDRFALLRANRAMALGFGVPVFLIFLIPLVVVVAMPAAVAGAAILVRVRLCPDPVIHKQQDEAHPG